MRRSRKRWNMSARITGDLEADRLGHERACSRYTGPHVVAGPGVALAGGRATACPSHLKGVALGSLASVALRAIAESARFG